MSILLSDWNIEKILPDADEKCGRCNCGVCDKVAKAAAIHAVQFMEGKCDNPKHIPAGFIQRANAVYSNAIPRRIDCSCCVDEIHEELGI